MNTTDGISVPEYYRHQRRFSWIRAGGGPQVTDWVAGAVVAALVLGFVALTHAPQHQEAQSTRVVVAAAKDSEIGPGSVAYASPSNVNK